MWQRSIFVMLLCAASEVAVDLSSNVDTKRLPESEAQARPLTRLKRPDQRRQLGISPSNGLSKLAAP